MSPGRRIEQVEGPTTRSELAYRSLRATIVRGELPSGTVLHDAELARQLGVSRTPIREALRRLEAAGFIALLPHGGFLIPELTPADLVDVFTVRRNLEGLAARLAAERRTRADLAFLDDLLDALDQALLDGDTLSRAELSGEIHDTIAAASRNRYAHAMLSNIRGVFDRYRPRAALNPVTRNGSHQMHHAIVEAIRAQDAAEAQRLMELDIDQGLAARLSGADAHVSV
jgi:DNA-binding GntR family transcriptional regulator